MLYNDNMNVDELIDLLSGDPIGRYRDTLRGILEDNKKKILKSTSRMKHGSRHNMSIREMERLKKIRMKSTDEIIKWAKYLDQKERDIFWDNLLKETMEL